MAQLQRVVYMMPAAAAMFRFFLRYVYAAALEEKAASEVAQKAPWR